ncbi:MAG: (Fe-S)-binding protein [Candidatus Moraniibacteriota bacterium]
MKLFQKLLQGNTLYYPGCLTKFVLKDIEDNYKEILRREGIDYIVLKDKELCCGSPAKAAGAYEEFKNLAKKNLQVLTNHGVDKIITNCPACAAVFKLDYKEALGEEWNIEIKHISEVITEKSIPASTNKKEATYHDSCHLGRVLGIYDNPRKIIQKAGYKIKEMELARNKSYCCGAGGGVKSNNPELSSRIGKDRISQAMEAEAGELITACPMCYAHLREQAKEKIKVRELSQIIIK